MTDLIAAAATAVDYTAWTTTENGDLIPQITTDTTIHTMLGLLDLEPGMRVMEIGTGSGYSGALLSEIVGPNGHVVSVDIDPALVERARARHDEAGHGNIEVHAADGFEGWADSAPYDRIVGWVTPHVIPSAWARQARQGAVLVTPVKIADVAGTNAVVRCTLDDEINGGELHPGSFIEMAPDVITNFGLPIRYVDAVRRLPDCPSWWISAHQLHDRSSSVADNLLDSLSRADLEPGFFDQGADGWRAFTAFVLASATDEAASAGGPLGWGIGVATPESVAVSLSNGGLLFAGTDDARNSLTDLLAQWRKDGEPDYTKLTPSYSHGGDGWTVRPEVATRV
ncbi:protein-L-isoaspartate O-methyltransferase family protein [Actinokineospora sp.]|uniref:protein-L-isoaspartate O-methyltransferase family protein n=1 Tax=Actinokineospora sp. TaxID=1872133 RepID=UPI004038343D